MVTILYQFIFRILFILITTGALCATLLDIKVQCQERPIETPMKRTELAEAAAVLKALTKGWDLIDSAPDIEFLTFVNEDRDELDFYPKKSFVQMMERTGLIENLDKEGSSLRQPYTHFEGDPSKGEWKEITEAGIVVIRYQVTQKGQRFLSDAPKLLGTHITINSRTMTFRSRICRKWEWYSLSSQTSSGSLW